MKKWQEEQADTTRSTTEAEHEEYLKQREEHLKQLKANPQAFLNKTTSTNLKKVVFEQQVFIAQSEMFNKAKRNPGITTKQLDHLMKLVRLDMERAAAHTLGIQDEDIQAMPYSIDQLDQYRTLSDLPSDLSNIQWPVTERNYAYCPDLLEDDTITEIPEEMM